MDCALRTPMRGRAATRAVSEAGVPLGNENTGSAGYGFDVASYIGGMGARTGAGGCSPGRDDPDASGGGEAKPAEAQAERPRTNPAAEGPKAGVARRLQDLAGAGCAVDYHVLRGRSLQAPVQR